MTRPWTRDDTKEWIIQLEHRLEDIDYYLKRTIEWCEENGVYENRTVFACSLMTAVWVSHMRNEPISILELFEMLGIKDLENVEDAVYEFNPQYADFEHEELLHMVASSF
jgi:hypothetical protein